MIYRAAAAFLLVIAILAAAYLFRPATTKPRALRPSQNGALLPEVELAEPKPAPMLIEQPGHGVPVALGEAAEAKPAPLLLNTPDMNVPKDAVFDTRPVSNPDVDRDDG